MESYLEDLQNQISHVLANSEVSALERMFLRSNAVMPIGAEILARVRLNVPKVRSITLGRPGNTKTLKLVYKYFLFSL
jgi:hypothetical protein